MKCGYYLKKVGGVHYGWKCEGYHKGSFTLYSNGNSIDYNTREGAQYNKEGRDKYVKEKCLTDCTKCTLFQGLQSHC